MARLWDKGLPLDERILKFTAGEDHVLDLRLLGQLSDTALTQDLLQNSSQRLKDALADLGLNQTSVSVSQGQTQGQSGRSSRSTPLTANREKLSEEPGLNIAVESGHRRNALSQFDSYA